MRAILLTISAAALASGITGVALAAKETPAVAYEKLLSGKTPGETVDCIDTRNTNAHVKAYGSKLTYRFSDKLVYVSETGGGCQRVERGDILVTRQFQQRLCRGDIATTIDPASRFYTGSCALGNFTPYRSQ